MKNGFTTIELIITLGCGVVFIGALALLVLIGGCTIKGCNKVQDVGLKGAVTDIWEGPQTNEVTE